MELFSLFQLKEKEIKTHKEKPLQNSNFVLPNSSSFFMEERGRESFFSGGFPSYNRPSSKPQDHHQLCPYNNFSCQPARPPLTAIDRFLSGQSRLNSQHQHDQYQNNAKNDREISQLVSANGFGSSWPEYHSTKDDHLQEESFFGAGIFVDHDNGEAIMNRTVLQERNGDTCFKGEADFVENYSCKEMGKRAKKASSAALIKGQWTDEEDRCVCVCIDI